MMYELVASLYSLREFIGNVYIFDIVDVFIIAVFLYIIIVLFKRTRSWPILVGIGVLGVIYAASQMFNLFLTSLALQSFFAVFIVVLVIIFQSELRRFFELISFWNTRQFKLKQEASGFPFHINELLQAAARLVNQKRGALIVFPGNENTDRFLNGGKQLDGLITEELLESIFDPHSPGHDGAVVIRKNRISQFGVHLPLAKNFKQLGKRGTRHSAALGISENTDALAVVISEERGTISLAHNGRLKEIQSVEELESSLKKFFRDTYTDPVSSFWSDFLKRNSFEKIIALGLAGVMWFFFSFQAETVQRSFTLPLVYRNLPEALFIEESEPREVSVTFVSRGENSFERADEQSVEVSVDAKDFMTGDNQIILTEDMVRHPAVLSVVEIVPLQIHVRVTEFRAFEVPIEADVAGDVASDVRIDSVVVIPEHIGILVPEGMLPPKSVQTVPVNITGLSASKVFSSRLLLPSNMRFRDSISPSVSVKVNVVKK
ncbi:MAG: DNA integrity scanning protein DisA nucleotide-binding domain protein [Candidatus Niyogibacteria bacterium]|nr:DNA integrity scanning protein DisA nucleotide-binding domain protein [Candidatus Niyogibacteria bacterium]